MGKSNSRQHRMKASASSGDLLDDITAGIVNNKKSSSQRRSRHSLENARQRSSLAKHIKNARQGRQGRQGRQAKGGNSKAVRRQFIPSIAEKGEEANPSRRSRTSALNKKMK